MELLFHVLEHSLEESIRLLPFLFLTYLAMEYLEHKAGEKTVSMLQRSGKYGPFIGGILGAFPQCGFSAAASNLYAGRIITLGTLIAIYLATSDEMLAIMISSRANAGTIGIILLVKVLIGMLAGSLIDLVCKMGKIQVHDHEHIHEMCEHDHCHCEEKSIVYSALIHSLQIFIFVLLVSVALNLVVELYGVEQLVQKVAIHPIRSVFICGMIGLIPNCASSVALTRLYLEGVLSAGSMFAGLLACAGVGVLVLLRANHRWKENLIIVGLLYSISVGIGLLIEILI